MVNPCENVLLVPFHYAHLPIQFFGGNSVVDFIGVRAAAGFGRTVYIILNKGTAFGFPAKSAADYFGTHTGKSVDILFTGAYFRGMVRSMLNTVKAGNNNIFGNTIAHFLQLVAYRYCHGVVGADNCTGRSLSVPCKPFNCFQRWYVPVIAVINHILPELYSVFGKYPFVAAKAQLGSRLALKACHKKCISYPVMIYNMTDKILVSAFVVGNYAVTALLAAVYKHNGNIFLLSRVYHLLQQITAVKRLVKNNESVQHIVIYEVVNRFSALIVAVIIIHIGNAVEYNKLEISGGGSLVKIRKKVRTETIMHLCKAHAYKLSVTYQNTHPFLIIKAKYINTLIRFSKIWYIITMIITQKLQIVNISKKAVAASQNF